VAPGIVSCGLPSIVTAAPVGVTRSEIADGCSCMAIACSVTLPSTTVILPT
jgi:hypothetical protein